jgi:apolipoprotein N-acyltransferase
VEDPTSASRFFNSGFVLAPDGRIAGRYDKRHLLPFAEYFPLSSVDLLNRSFGRVRQFSPGESDGTLDTPAGKAGVLICNEAMFGRFARERVADGAAFLTLLSNDSWVDDPMFGLHQLQIAVLRAIEQRRLVIRASTSGPSAVIDARGRVLAVSQPRSRATLTGTIRGSSVRSIYSRVGDLFAWSCVAVVAAALLLRRRVDDC